MPGARRRLEVLPENRSGARGDVLVAQKGQQGEHRDDPCALHATRLLLLPSSKKPWPMATQDCFHEFLYFCLSLHALRDRGLEKLLKLGSILGIV